MITIHHALSSGIRIVIRDSHGNMVYDCMIETGDKK